MAEKKDKDKNIIREEKEEKIIDLKTDDIKVVEQKISPLESAIKEAEEYKNSLIRLQADFENYKKRNNDIAARMYSTGVSDAIERIFPMLDSLDIASSMYQDKQKEGIELIIKQFMTALESLGVKEIEAINKDFNPEQHEAVARCAVEEGQEELSGKVKEVFRKGYIYRDKVIRPSMVKVYE